MMCSISDKAAPQDQDTNSSASGTQTFPMTNTSHNHVVSSSPAASLAPSPCQSPMLREEDELSDTGESGGEDDDEGPVPGGVESDAEAVTEVDMSDVDMNKVSCSVSQFALEYDHLM